MKEKDYDAIAREIHTRHHIFVNDTFDRKEISEIVAILRKHDEAEESGERYESISLFLDDVKETSRMVQVVGPDGRTAMYWEDWINHLDKVFSKATIARSAQSDDTALRKALQRMTNRSNRITCPFRHQHDVRAIRADDIESLYEAQLEAESILAREAPKDESKEGGA